MEYVGDNGQLWFCLMRSLCQVVFKPDLDAEHKGLIASLPHELTLLYIIITISVIVKILGIIYILCSGSAVVESTRANPECLFFKR